MGSILAITGTDTGVGKTHVSCGVLRLALRSGLSIAPLKLVETGCRPGPSGLVAEDASCLARAAGLASQNDVVLERFELPAAPATAARAVGRELRFAPLLERVRAVASAADVVLLEGAGGLLVPIGPDGSFADLFQALAARLVIVARDALGTLNHTLLTLEAAERRELAVAAVVLNATPEPCELHHRGELRAVTPRTPVLGPLPWQPGATPDQVADELTLAGADVRRWLGIERER